MFWRRAAPLPLTEATKVTVNVWLPRLNGVVCTAQAFIAAHSEAAAQGQAVIGGIGHASLATPTRYASWWPNPENEEQVRLFNVVPAQNSTYEQDIISEGGLVPDLQVSFYSLDVQAIEACFQDIQDTAVGYVLTGDKATTRLLNEQRGQSCCGLAYELLMAGGISRHASITQDLKARWVVVTPDNFADFIRHAKASEWAAHPETQAFLVAEGEYTPPPPPASGWSCQIL